MKIQELWGLWPESASPVLLKTEEGHPQHPKVKEDVGSAVREDDEEAWYVCRNCQQRLAHSSARKAMQGSHTHTFANPSGVVFEIGCFSTAQGYSFLGPASTDFSWFSGYSWRIIVCSVCVIHLGWFFASQSGSGFFGLITDRIIFLSNRAK